MCLVRRTLEAGPRDCTSAHYLGKSRDRPRCRKHRSDEHRRFNRGRQGQTPGPLIQSDKISILYIRLMLTTSSEGRAEDRDASSLYHFVFFSATDSCACLPNSSAARRLSRLSRPRVTMDLGSRSANRYLQTCSIPQQPMKSIIIDAVRRTLNCWQSAQIKYGKKTDNGPHCPFQPPVTID
jgi:hypothetical protein